MSTFKDRFNQAVEESGKSRAQISRETGISEPLLHHYAAGRNEPKQPNIEKLSKSLHRSVDWLVTGIEPKPDVVLVETYKRLSERQQEELLRYARYLEQEDRNNV